VHDVALGLPGAEGEVMGNVFKALGRLLKRNAYVIQPAVEAEIARRIPGAAVILTARQKRKETNMDSEQTGTAGTDVSVPVNLGPVTVEVNPVQKAGVKTTEFYVTLAATIFSAAVAAGVIPQADKWVTVVSAVGTVLLALGYSWGRALVKAAAAKK
jgi:hypothetical protein